MRRKNKLLAIPSLPLFILLLLSSHVRAGDTIPYGQIVDSLPITTHPNESYALYLPSFYTPENLWPVIFFFDPAARGAYPLELYTKIAEQEGIVMVASNQSRNYLPFSEIDNIAKRMIRDIELNYSIDPTRRYTCGFSGGSRVAANVALAQKMTGILGCGAGFALPLEIPDTLSELVYTGMVGTQDMNYQEMFELEQELGKRESPAIILTGRYGHTWAPDTLFYEAWKWQQLFYYRDFETLDSTRNIAGLLSQISHSQLKLIDQGNMLQAVRNYYTLKHYFPDRAELRELSSKTGSIETSKTYLKQKKEVEKYQSRERSVQQEIYKKMKQHRYTVNLEDSLQNYWIDKINSFQHMQRSRKPLKADYALRQLNLIAALCSENIQELSYLPQEERLLLFSKLWVKANPENRYAYLYLARAQALSRQDNQVFKNLKISISLGFNNRDRLMNDEAFAPYLTNAVFIELLESL